MRLSTAPDRDAADRAFARTMGFDFVNAAGVLGEG